MNPQTTMYLDLLKSCLTRSLFPDGLLEIKPKSSTFRGTILSMLDKIVRRAGLVLARPDTQTDVDRFEGKGWPLLAETMMGRRRLDILQEWIEILLDEKVPGDLFEAGMWKGGGAILMLGALKAFGETERMVWAADSFQGYPRPSAESHTEDIILWNNSDYFSVSRESVEKTLSRYGLLSRQIQILPGWFSETLPSSQIKSLALIRIDVDGYEPTLDVLNNLYEKLSPGGFCIVEDFRAPGCRRAVEEFRLHFAVGDPLHKVPQSESIGVFWRKGSVTND